MVQLILPTMTTDDVGSAWDDDDNQEQNHDIANQDKADNSDDFPTEWTDNNNNKTIPFMRAAGEIKEIRDIREYMQYNPEEDPFADIN